MFKVLALVLMFAVFSANYTPNWKSCSDPSDSWHPTSVSFDQPPAHGQVSHLTICGESVDTFTLYSFQYSIKVLNIVVHTGSGLVKPPTNATAGEIACSTFRLAIPNFIIGTLEAQMEGLDPQGNERGCLLFYVTL